MSCKDKDAYTEVHLHKQKLRKSMINPQSHLGSLSDYFIN